MMDNTNLAPASALENHRPTQPFNAAPQAPTQAPQLTALDYRPPGPEATLSSTPATVSDLPKRFGKYEVLGKIGSGGMGIVYKARDAALDRLVALKTLRNGVLADQLDILRFLREAKAVAQLRDPHIITIYDSGLHEGIPFFVMELLSGETLSKWREHYSQAPPLEAVVVVEKIARALQAAHDQSIVHRDIKPGNVLLDNQGEPKISDFGLAKFLEADGDLTQTGYLIGTPAYMSPEQTAGLHEKVSPATDVWALGVVLYELLTKQRPFGGKSNEELKSNIKSGLPTAPTKRRRDLPRSLEAIILKCLEKDPARRYQHGLALAEDLARWRQGQTPIARPLSPWQTLGTMARTRWKALTAIALGLALVAGLLIGLAPGPAQPSWSQKLQAKLAKDKKVVLLADQGRIENFDWVHGAEVSTANLNDDKQFWINSGKTGLMELFRVEDDATYRLQADILHDSASQWDSQVGLYAGQQLFPHPEGVGRSFVKFGFNDLRLPEPNNKLEKGKLPIVRLKNTIFQDAAWGGEIHLHSEDANFIRKPKTWRTLRLEVSTWQLTATWLENDQARRVAQWDWDKFADNNKLLLSMQDFLPFGVKDLPQSFRGGMGFYLFRSAIFVKNVSIEKL